MEQDRLDRARERDGGWEAEDADKAWGGDVWEVPRPPGREAFAFARPVDRHLHIVKGSLARPCVVQNAAPKWPADHKANTPSLFVCDY